MTYKMCYLGKFLYCTLTIVAFLYISGSKADNLDKFAEFARKYIQEQRYNDQGPPKDDPPLPDVPQSYMTDVEISFKNPDQKFTIVGKEGYDGEHEKGIFQFQFEGKADTLKPKIVQETIHFNVKRDQALYITEDATCDVEGEENCEPRSTCEAGDMNSINQYISKLFGFESILGEDWEFKGSESILEFGPDYNYTFSQEDACHGMRCNIFISHQFDEKVNAHYVSTFAWTTDEWHMHNNGHSVPVYEMGYANGTFGGSEFKEIVSQYDYFNFKRDYKPSAYELEPPAEVYCTNKTSILNPPIDPNHFSLMSESIAGFNYDVPLGNETVTLRIRLVFYGQEFYDYEEQVTRVDFTPIGVKGEQSFENRQSLVHDFKQELTYTIAPGNQTCSIKKLDKSTSWGEVEQKPDGSFQLISPFDIYKTIDNWQYNGRHIERGILCDVWTGLKETKNTTDVFTLYYASPLSNDITGYSNAKDQPPAIIIKSHDKVPIKISKYSPLNPKEPDFEYNVVGFESQTPRSHEIDISPCFKREKMRHYIFALPADTLNRTRHLRDNVLYSTADALAKTGNVTFIRINRIEIASVNSTGLYIRFTLLDKPSLQSGVVDNLMESDFDAAESKIKNSIDQSKLEVKILYRTFLGEEIFHIAKAQPYTLLEVERDDGTVNGKKSEPGFSPGDMAGLGCGMVILGMMLGFFSMYIYSVKTK